MTGRRILLVVQRYGADVVGGSEQHARLVAQRLAQRHTVEIATTTALDYWTWAPHYRSGDDVLDGLLVRRFAVTAGRDPAFKTFEHHVLEEDHTVTDELAWPDRQGPVAPGLLEFLHVHGREYDAVLFYTYIYAPTALGLPIVPERAALISTAHDEYPLRLAPYRALFHLPRAMGYLTPEERSMVHARFHNEQLPDEVLGYALGDAPAADSDAFRAHHGIDGPYVLYLGQVSEGKGCDELLGEWIAHRAAGGAADTTLVLAGTVRMALPDRPDVRALGRITDLDKAGALAGAIALVQPSRLESLGIVLFEAWQYGTPVLVHRANLVTSGQTERAAAGRSYADHGFGAALDALIAERHALGAAGRAFVERECSFAGFDERLERLIEATVAA
ncbi:MAG: glycosyltransferase family 4 protein [Chloroflexota bacterium]|nr:glycosyltransferase family 4 protein [Chloroflexota bacterium]